MLQKRWLNLLAALSALTLAGCAHGPRVNYCVLDGSASARAQCSNGKTQTELLNWACLSPADVKTALSACKKYRPSLTYCVVSDTALVCADSEGHAGFLSFLKANGYACLSPQDEKSIMRYCRWNQ